MTCLRCATPRKCAVHGCCPGTWPSEGHIEAAASQMGVDYGDALCRIAGMPQSSKEKQEAFRARNAMLGLTEVRGIFLPPELHAELKAHAQKLAAKVKARKASTEVLPAKGTLG